MLSVYFKRVRVALSDLLGFSRTVQNYRNDLIYVLVFFLDRNYLGRAVSYKLKNVN